MTYRISRFVRRHRVGVATTAVVALALIAGLAGTTWQASVARRERDHATRRFEDVRALAHAVVFDLHDAIADLPGVDASPRDARAPRAPLPRRTESRVRGRSRASVRAGAGVREDRRRPGPADVREPRPVDPSAGELPQVLGVAARRRHGVAGVAGRGAGRADYHPAPRRPAAHHGPRSRGALDLSEGEQRLRVAITRHPASVELQRDLGVTCDRLFDMKLAAGDTAGAIAESDEDGPSSSTTADSSRGIPVTNARG